MATTTSQPSSSLAPKPEKRDFRQEVTDRIVNMLETGVAPWQKRKRLVNRLAPPSLSI